MKFLKYCTIAIFLAFSLSLFAAEPIDPATLKQQWWENFKQEPGTLADKGKDLVAQIQKVIPAMTDENKVKAEELIRRIALNFVTYDKIQHAQPITIPPITPSADTYPVDEALEIARKIQSENLVIKNLKDERAERLNQINAVQEELDRLAKTYFKQTEPNEERFLLGLKLINYQIVLAAAKEDLNRLNNGITGYEAYVKRLNDELLVSENHLSASSEEVSRVKAAEEEALRRWQSTQAALRQKEADQLSRSADFDTGSTSPASRLMDQERMELMLAEMSAYENYLSLQIKGALLTLLAHPRLVNLNALTKEAAQWSQSLGNFLQKVTKYTNSTQREIQRTGQLLSLASTTDGEGSKDRAAQQSIIELAQKNLLALQKLRSDVQDSQFMLDSLDTQLTKEIGGSVRLGQLVIGYLKSFWTAIGEWFETPLFHIGTQPVLLSSLIKFLAILLLTFWGSRKFIYWMTQWATSQKRMEKSLLYRISRLIYYLLLTIGFIIALSSIGFDFSSFLLIAGALGVGLGFGLQAIFNNFLSGLILLFESQIKVGDFVEIASGVKGEVKEINVRSTIITMADGLDVIVPNSEMISTRVVNWTLIHPYRRIQIPFSVAYGSDKDLVRKVISEAAAKMPQTLVKPGFSDPNVVMTRFGDSGIEFDLYVWVNEKYSKLPMRAASDYLWMVDDVLKANHIEIPYNRLDINMVNHANAT